MDVKRTWQDNGTKILGYIGIVFGALSVLDTATVDLATHALGPKLGPAFKGLCVIAGAVTVAMRGHKNTADIAEAVVSRASTGEVQASAKVVTDVAKTAVAADDKAASAATDPPKEPKV
jgi:hypothetical protein